MYFASDNCAGAHPAIAASLTHNAGGFAAAYGESDLDKKVEQRFNEIFEREVAVYFVGTGTAANSLALASINRPGGIVFCHREAHVIEDECGAPEYFTNGSRLHPVDGALGKIDPVNLRRELQRFIPVSVHSGQPMAVTITQSTEAGTLYQPEEIAAISQICREFNIPLHLDGARFANALVSLNVSPADMSWRQGVDIISFGGTKNGCWCAEALVFMNPKQAKDLPFIRKRSAQLFSKTRFIAAQFAAYLQDDLWLDLARHANSMSSRLAVAIKQSDKIALAWQPQANEVFATIKKTDYEWLLSQGAALYDWKPPHDAKPIADDETYIRLVTSFATTEAEIDTFIELIKKL